jgi:hypothetical protein
MADQKRPGLKVGARTEFLVIGDVIPGHEDARDPARSSRSHRSTGGPGCLPPCKFTRSFRSYDDGSSGHVR